MIVGLRMVFSELTSIQVPGQTRLALKYFTGLRVYGPTVPDGGNSYIREGEFGVLRKVSVDIMKGYSNKS